jgi:hypothetical protein
MVPADAVLLVAAALLATMAWMDDRTPSWVLLALSILAYPLIVVRIFVVAFFSRDYARRKRLARRN